jgi:hypothetical protein
MVARSRTLPPTIDGIDVDEFIRQNADAIWLLRNEMYELLDEHSTPSPDGGCSEDDCDQQPDQQ